MSQYLLLLRGQFETFSDEQREKMEKLSMALLRKPKKPSAAIL